MLTAFKQDNKLYKKYFILTFIVYIKLINTDLFIVLNIKVNNIKF
jgi:hypothetical protein